MRRTQAGYRIVIATMLAAFASLVGAQFTELGTLLRADTQAEACTLGEGYWKNHSKAWPVRSLVLGDEANPLNTYSQTELLRILDMPANGDASIILAYQLIAAKLNVAHGSNPAPIATHLVNADRLLGGYRTKLPSGVPLTSTNGSAMVAIEAVLDDYNNGRIANSCGGQPTNTPPIANAGSDQTAALGATVHLNGTASSDPDGDPLTFSWSFVSKPAASVAALVSPASVTPTFTADVPGTYELRLIVNDGRADSTPDSVRISTENSRPIANAGPDQSLLVGAVAHLDGHLSADPDGNSLSFAWTFVSRPSGSGAILSNPTGVTPQFTIDRPGEYTVQLIVNDGTLASPPDTISISTINSAPVADAGADVTAPVQTTVTLDGSRSTDIDGDAITYKWSLLSKPAASQTTLGNATAVNPTVVVDAAGIYVVQLIVNDGHVDSAADTISVSTGNTAPVANAGPDTNTFVGDTVQLDGSASTDLDGNPLTYKWALTTRPAGSIAALSDSTAVKPTFVIDLAGDYIAQLIVNDGTLDSTPDTTRISSSTRNHPPVADAGIAQTVPLGSTIQLNGSASSDPDSDPITFKWSLLAAPVNSTASLSDASSPKPTFVAEQAGSYVAQLIVNDGALDSSPKTVTVSTQNSLPVANAGPDQAVTTGGSVQLDGSASFDPDGAALHFAWSLLARPVASASVITDSAAVKPSFVPDVDGDYVAQLIVDDGTLSSGPDTVTVTAQQPADLGVSFFDQPREPAIGGVATMAIQVENHGPSAVGGVVATFKVPAGYALRNVSVSVGTYDQVTGLWNIGSLPVNNFASISADAFITATGPYDLSASVTGKAADPDLSNNSATVHVVVDTNADVKVRFVQVPSGTLVPDTATPRLVHLEVSNQGPSSTENVTARFALPSGYTLCCGGASVTGTWDPATGLWTIGAMSRFQIANWIGFVFVNPTGSTALTAAILSSSQPDPNPPNNVATAPAINRRPIANAGPDQSVAAHAEVTLDGTLTADPEGDPFTYQWTFAQRPANSGATIANPTTATPRFTPDLGGHYIVSLIATDKHGTPSLADTVVITATEFNHAPVIRSKAKTAAFVGETYRYNVTATDPDAGDVLTFTLTMSPTGMSIDGPTGVISWAPNADQGGPHSVTVRATDAGGLFAAQTFAIQVSSDSDRAPAANPDSYSVRLGESLGIGAPGVLANDLDTDGHALTARLLTPPVNGTLGFNADGSFTYTPFTLRKDEYVLAENISLATRIPGVAVAVSSTLGFGGDCPAPKCAIDDSIATGWLNNDFSPFIELGFPQDVTVAHIQIVGDRESVHPRKVTAGIVELRDADGTLLYTSGNVELPGPLFDVTVNAPDVAGVRRVRFAITTTTDGPLFSSGIAEMRVIGSTLLRRYSKTEPNLDQLLPSFAAASNTVVNNPPESVLDDALYTNWYSPAAAPGEFIEVTLPADATITQIETVNASARPDGFGTSLEFHCSGAFELFDAQGTSLFNSGIVATPTGPTGRLFTLPVPNVAAVRRARYTATDCSGSGLPVGFAEFRLIGSAAVDAPALSLAKKLQTLTGREAHSTPIVVNLTDDNLDGKIDVNDIPDILVPVEAVGNQLQGEIKVVSGDDGHELFTAGGPNLVSPWSEAAVGDLDGDGIPEIVAVHSDGSHLIAFDHTGATKWISDANPMPRFDLGGRFIIGGAVSIANLDGAGAPEIIVGASVFDALGHLLGDGRTFGGTTAGTGLRSAVSAVADIDLDGVPEIVAGPTAYRLVNGALTKVWQRTDRADGYVAIANFDDDPKAEIVVVASGSVYMLSHDGSDVEIWNAPTHAPVAIPGGGQGGAPLIVDVDGDGLPEIGVAGASRYVLFNRDGSVRWASSITDRSSNSTGAVAFDLDGDGAVEIIYRDEQFLRVFRGADGVLLAKFAIGSSTWAEQPVVVDADNDGHADIVVSSDFFNQPIGAQDTGLIILQDVANKWTRTRRIWNQHSYHVTNVNEDGTIPVNEVPHWLVSGLNAFRVNQFIPGETPDGTDSFSYAASDGTLEAATTVQIAIRTPNSPPAFTSVPIGHAASSVAYVYAAQAKDPDANDILSFSLPTAPAGMTIDPATGVISWTPGGAQTGSHDVTVKVRDVHGLFAVQGYAVTVGSAVAVPDVVGQPKSSASGTIADASLTVGAITTRNSPTAPLDSVISQAPAAGTLVAPAAPISLVVSSGPAAAGTVPDVVGQAQSHAQLDVVAAGFVVGVVSGQNSGTVAVGIVLAQVPAAGSQAQSGSAVNLVVSLGPPPEDLDLDHDGFTGRLGDCNDTNPLIHPGAFDIPSDGIDQDCNGRDAIVGDSTPPGATIISPVDLATLSMPADVVGSATDANFLRYTLTLAEVDSAAAITIASGASPVPNGVLGRIDPTLLENGLYRLRLVAEDVNGQTSVDERVYRIDGTAKVGNFRLSFIDLSVPVAGIPITVTRTYDSRVKTREDFGIGWTLGIKRGTYRHNRTPGQGWIIRDQPFLGSFLPCIGGTTETRSHLTEVRLSDRESYMFALAVDNGNLGVTGACEGVASFRFVNGTRTGATLEILDSRSVIYLRGGDDVVLDMNSFLAGTPKAYDPQRVRLITADGRRIELERQGGITRIEDLNGNTLSINANGIVHSSGKSISFIRDTLSRITRITDPAGNTLAYTYDDRGDLTTFADQADQSQNFAYDTRHNLVEVRDPLGRASRSEYDSDGRLVAVIDPLGNRTTMAHDIDARQETVTDRVGNVTVLAYDDRGNVIRRTDALGHATAFTYDPRDNLLSETDPLGNTRTYGYDTRDNRTSDTDAVGNTTSFTFNSINQVLTTSDPRGGVTTRTYDSKGNLVALVDAAGGRVTHTYDSHGNRIGTTDRLGSKRTWSYDADGNVTSATDPLGNVINTARDANGNPVRESRRRVVGGVAQVATTLFAYDGLNRRVSLTNAGGAEASVSYTPSGKVETATDPYGEKTTTAYDDNDRSVRTVYPDGTSEATTYDREGRRLTLVDRAGRTTQFNYDAIGRLLTTTYPGGAVVSNAYDAAGRKVSETDPLGRITRFNYDATGHLTGTLEPSGATTSTTYDAGGNVASTTDRNGHVTTFQYDGENRLVRSTFADGTSVSETFDAAGQRISRTDQAGNTTRFEYNQRGALTRVVDALGNATAYAFDELDKRVSQTDPLGHTKRFTYDVLGRVIQTTLPLGQAEARTYDIGGRLTALRDFNGAVTTYTYDVMGRLATRNLPDGQSHSFAYTPSGQLASFTDAGGPTTFSYDERDRPTTVHRPDNEEIHYTYDAAGNWTAVSTPGGATTYAYDLVNRLAALTDPAGRQSTFSYDLQGNLTSIGYPNGITTHYEYDSLNRLTDLTHAGSTTLRSFHYTNGPAGNRTRVVEDTGRTVDYSYDALFRLTQEDINGPGNTALTLGYTYDAAGNRISRIGPGGAVGYTYDANNRMTQFGPTTFTYDANGNQLSAFDGSATTTYEYDGLNRLARTSSPRGATQFDYDAMGHRLKKTDAAGATHYLVDPFGNGDLSQVLRETNSSGAVDYVFGGGILLSMRQGSATSFYLHDGRMSTRLLTDETGVVTDRYDYDAFGNLLGREGTTANQYLFDGQQLDPALQMYNLRARYYDPAAGRFTQPDPVAGVIFEPASLHPYTYAYNDPVNKSDPSGKFTLLEQMTISASVGVIAAIGYSAENYYYYRSGELAFEVGVDSFFSFASLTMDALGLGSLIRSFGMAVVEGVGQALAGKTLINQTARNAGKSIETRLTEVLEEVLCRTNIPKKCGPLVVTSAEEARVAIEGMEAAQKQAVQAALEESKRKAAETAARQAVKFQTEVTNKELSEVAVESGSGALRTFGRKILSVFGR